MCHGDSGVSRRGNSSGDTWDDFERNPGFVQRLCLFAATAEHEGVAPLEANNAFSFAPEFHQEGVDLFLARRLSCPAALADVIELRPSGFARTRRQERRVG